MGDIAFIKLSLEGASKFSALFCANGPHRLSGGGDVVGDAALQRSHRVILARQELGHLVPTVIIHDDHDVLAAPQAGCGHRPYQVDVQQHRSY